MEARLRDRIVIYRAKNRMSQAEFARACGITTPTVCKIENGYERFNKITLAKIEMVLNGTKRGLEI